jgi:integrase
MPWRKYEAGSKTGKHGKSYYVDRGIQVRKDRRGKWAVYAQRNGRRKNRTVGEGREGLIRAIKLAEAIAAQKERGLTPQRDAAADKRLPAFIDYAHEWYRAGYKKWKDCTAERYEEILRIYIEPSTCFKKPIDQVGRRDIKDFLARVYQSKSPSTVESINAVISGVFNEAVDDEIIRGNPAAGLLKRILPPKNRRNQKKADPFSAAECEVFLAKADQLCNRTQQMIFKSMLYGGLRLGEALAMRRCKLELMNQAYLVTESFKRRQFSTPKSGKERLVDLPAFWCEELRSYLAYLKKESLRNGRGGQVDLLFEDPKEKGGPWPYSQRKVQYQMKKICESAGLRVRNPHDLRHTYATRLLMAHQSPAYVQKQLGHHSISLTVDTYGHWIPGEGRGQLDAALGGDVTDGEISGGLVQKKHILAYPSQKARDILTSN